MATRQHATHTMTLHFNLSHLERKHGYTVRVAMREYHVHAHTHETLAEHKQVNGFLRHIPDEQITHYAPDVELPANAMAIIMVYGPSEGKHGGKGPLLGMKIHVPAERRKAFWDAYPHVREQVVRHRLAFYQEGQTQLGAMTTETVPVIGEGSLDVAVAEAAALPAIAFYIGSFLDPQDTAVSLVFYHPELLNLNSTGQSGNGSDAPAIRILDMHILGNKNAIMSLNLLARTIRRLGDDWATQVPVVDAQGQQIVHNGHPQFTNQISQDVKDLMGAPTYPALQTSKNDTALQGKVWTVQHGITSMSQNTSSFNAPRSILTAPLGDESYTWQVSNITPHYGLTIDPVTPQNVTKASNGDTVVSLTATNYYLRHLGAYVQFLDPTGQVVTVDWDNIPEKEVLLKPIYEPNEKTKYITVIPPTEVICGVPIGSKQATLEVQFPATASTAQIKCGGLGTGSYDGDVTPLGLILTVICELTVPVIVLAAGAAAEENAWAEAIVESSDLLWSLLDPVAFLFDGSTEISDDPKPFIAKLIEKMGLWLFSKALVEFITLKIAQGALEEATPIADAIMEAINVAITMAEIAETTVEVCLSPFVIEANVNRTMDFTVNLTPADLNFPYFPGLATSYLVNVQYSTDATYCHYNGTMPLHQTKTLPSVHFNGVPAGGQVKFDVFFYAANGWLAGKGSSGWMPADSAHATVNVPITNSEIPLDKNTIYQHKQQLTCTGGSYSWVGTQPSETIANLQASLNEGHYLGRLQGITLAQAPGMLGYTWMASGLNQPQEQSDGPRTNDQSWTFQNIELATDTPAHALKYPPFSFKSQPALVYDVYGPADGSGYNFYVDSRNGQYHLRRVSLDENTFSSQNATNPFDPTEALSWGRFTLSSDAIAIHPSGFVVSINSANHKLEILQVPAVGCPDAAAPPAVILSGMGNRDGLVFNPVALSVTHDGRILVLQTGGSLYDPTIPSGQTPVPACILAFDVKGNPVKCFPSTDNANASASFQLIQPSSPRTYLDMGVEAKGYIYVVSYEGNGHDPSDYYLDIYDPSGIPIKGNTGQSGFNVAKIAVSPDRYVYTLNFRMIQGPDGRTEPSVSLWCPSAP